MTDLAEIKSFDREVELTHPANPDKGVGWFFQLRSPYSPEVRAAERKWKDKRLANMQKRRGNQTLNTDSLEAQSEDLILAAVTGWRFEGDTKFKGEQPEFSTAKLREILRTDEDICIHVRNFLDEQLGDVGGFFGN